MNRAPLDAVIAELRDHGCNPRQSHDGQWEARCPNGAGHNRGDKRPSLSVSVGADDRALLHCQAGCAPTAVAEALGLKVADLFTPPTANGNGHRPQVVERYDYRDAADALLFQVERLDPKGFRQRRPVADGWAYNLQGVDSRPLYRLPAVLRAVAERVPVWVVEGEKDVHALERAGYVATTCPMGAGKWRAEHTATLEWADANIVADDDPAGRDHALAVRAAIWPVATSVQLWLPAEGYKDIAEHLGAGYGLDKLRPWANEAEPLDEPEPGPLSRLRAALIHGEQITQMPAVEWLVPGLIQRNSLAALYGAPKSFKSFIAIDLALHLANGRPWRSRTASNSVRVLYVAAEGAPGVGPRAAAWCNYHDGRLDGMSWVPISPSLFKTDGEAHELAEIAAEHGCELVIVDTLARSIPGAEENSAKDLGLVIEHLDIIRTVSGATVLVVHHMGKNGAQGMRGSSALHGAIDTGLEVVGDRESVRMTLADQKNGESGDVWWWKPQLHMGSVVLTPSAQPVGDEDVVALNILKQLVDLGGTAANGEWAAVVKGHLQIARFAFEARRADLLKAGRVRQHRDGALLVWTVTAAGLEALRVD